MVCNALVSKDAPKFGLVHPCSQEHCIPWKACPWSGAQLHTSSETSCTNHPGGGLGLSEATCRRAALALNATGFVVLRGASIFSDEELAMAQAVAEAELLKVKQATEKIGQTLLERAPWIQGRGWMKSCFSSQTFQLRFGFRCS